MVFKIQKREGHQPKKYEKKDIDLAYAFARSASHQFGTFLRAVVLFGSTTKIDTPHHGDIDILMVVDDVMYMLTPEVVEAYRVIVEKLIADTSLKLHITTLKFTTFWDYIRVADPVGMNMLRNGVALIDTGFFYPLQLLLLQGRIRPTPEAADSYFSRSPTTLFNSRWHVLQGTVDLYWAVIDSAQAALMKYGELPPPPKEVSHALDRVFVKRNLLHESYVKTMQKFYTLSKMILHREIKEIEGKTYEAYYQEARDFVDMMRRLMQAKRV